MKPVTNSHKSALKFSNPERKNKMNSVQHPKQCHQRNQFSIGRRGKSKNKYLKLLTNSVLNILCYLRHDELLIHEMSFNWNSKRENK